MAEYIYRIKPDLTTVQDIFDTDGIVVWDVISPINKLFAGDTLYIYICKPDKQNQPVFCETNTIAYVANIVEVLDTFYSRTKKYTKKLKLKLTPLSFLAVERIKSANLRQNGYHPRYSLTDLSEKTNLKNIIDEADQYQVLC